MRDIFEMPNDAVVFMARLPTAALVNEHIISQLIYVIMKHDVDALKFCDTLEDLLNGSSNSQQFLASLKQGEMFI